MDYKAKPDQDINNGYDDPDNWKWGVFYYNKNDPRLFPPKRIAGMGWTINFANYISVLTFVVIIVITLIAGIVLKAYTPK